MFKLSFPKCLVSVVCDTGSSFVLLDFEEEEDHNDLEDSGYAEASQCSHSVEQVEDWEANV